MVTGVVALLRLGCWLWGWILGFGCYSLVCSFGMTNSGFFFGFEWLFVLSFIVGGLLCLVGIVLYFNCLVVLCCAVA